MKKAAIYDPYIDTFGGGERYMLSIAKVIGNAGWSVDIQADDKDTLKKAKSRFGMTISNANVVPSIERGDNYDLCVWLSDGSIPTLRARNNILHFQRPFWNVDGKSLINRMKLFRINKVIVNSEFTKHWIDNEYPVDSMVIYPPVDVDSIKSRRKENLIVGIGRFSQLEQSKRQDVLIDVFKSIYDKGRHDWKMVLAGGSEVGRTEYVDQLYESAKGYPIKIIENPPFETIRKLYGQAKVFWTASGYGEDEQKDPNKVEHFGITTVEAMSAGAVVFAYGAGGHKETVEDGKNGYLWNDKAELAAKFNELLKVKNTFGILSKAAVESVQKYSFESFEKNFIGLVK